MYVLSMTKSNFRLSDQQLIREGSSFYRLEGMVHDPHNAESLRLTFKLQRGSRKVIEYDGMPLPRPLDHIGRVPVVMITPDEMELVNESHIQRRKLANTTLSQTDSDYLNHLAFYTRILKQRNSLLKSWRETGKGDHTLLQTYNQAMKPHATYIFQERTMFFDQMLEKIDSYYTSLSDAREEVGMNYSSQLQEKGYSELLEESLRKDLARGITTVGPHRDKVDFSINGHNARTFASQGQKKSLVFAIKLAQLEFMKKVVKGIPILLLDDIFDRLDQSRVDRLLSIILSDTFGQVFITDTQVDRLDGIVQNYKINHQSIKVDAEE